MTNTEPREPRNGSRIRATRFFDHPCEARYDRVRDLPRLLPLLAEDLDTTTIASHRRLLALLRRALRAERLRSGRRHWTYDPARHAALARAARIENAALRRRCDRLETHWRG